MGCWELFHMLMMLLFLLLLLLPLCRACWYDRLGYGWSNDAFLYPTADQAAVVLRNTLQAAGEAGPFIVAGHSAGGQLALAFAGYHPELVSGIALLDSYDDVAIALGYLGSKEVTLSLPSGRNIVRPQLSQMNPALVGVIDIVRGITPLAWARFITMHTGGGYPYQGRLNAMYGESLPRGRHSVLVAHRADHGCDASRLEYLQTGSAGCNILALLHLHRDACCPAACNDMAVFLPCSLFWRRMLCSCCRQQQGVARAVGCCCRCCPWYCWHIRPAG
jgi:pimeloyl-ACP methyl ester carboxylesterase